MDLDSRLLTTCEISADGKVISLGFVDSEGKPNAVRFPVEQVGALAMTLPGLLETALRLKYSDDSLRYTYPLGSWRFEQSSDPANSIVTFSTVDGFSVCFTVPREQRDELEDDLAGRGIRTAVPLPN